MTKFSRIMGLIPDEEPKASKPIKRASDPVSPVTPLDRSVNSDRFELRRSGDRYGVYDARLNRFAGFGIEGIARQALEQLRADGASLSHLSWTHTSTMDEYPVAVDIPVAEAQRIARRSRFKLVKSWFGSKYGVRDESDGQIYPASSLEGAGALWARLTANVDTSSYTSGKYLFYHEIDDQGNRIRAPRRSSSLSGLKLTVTILAIIGILCGALGLFFAIRSSSWFSVGFNVFIMTINVHTVWRMTR